MSDAFRYRFPKAQQGISLVELMVAMVIGLMLVSMAASYLISSSASNRTVMASSDVQDAKRFALQVIQRQIWLAGYSDDALGSLTEAFPESDALESGVPAFQAAQLLVSDSDEAVWVRYRAAALDEQPITQCDGTTLSPDEASADGELAIAALYLKDSKLYCKVYKPDGDAANAVPLLNGIDRLRWYYLYDGAWERQADLAADAWKEIRAVRVEAIISSIQTSGRQLQSFVWGEDTLSFSDGLARSLFSAAIALRNLPEGATL